MAHMDAFNGYAGRNPLSHVLYLYMHKVTTSTTYYRGFPTILQTSMVLTFLIPYHLTLLVVSK